MREDLNSFEMINYEIGFYVTLLRIKKAETAENTELDYQIKVQKNKLAVLGVNTENFEYQKNVTCNERCKVYLVIDLAP